MKLRFLISIGCPKSAASHRVSRAPSHGFSCVSPLPPRKPVCRFSVVIVRTDIAAFPQRPQGRRLRLNNEATYRFAFAATRRFAGPTQWAVVRELNASGYPLHLPLSYMGELPNSHGRTSTGKSYDLHGIRTSLSLQDPRSFFWEAAGVGCRIVL